MNQFCKLTNALMATKGASHMFLFLSFSCFLLLMGHSYSQRDSLQQGDELKDGEVLDSSFGKFTLGFFTPSFSSSYSSISSSSKRYVGIWYNQPGDRYDSAYYDGEQSSKAVWIANRNIPILGKSGSLRIDRTDGNLKIFHIGGIPIPITSVKAAGNTSVTLQQSGNLVLHELHPNGSIKGMLWQSFDYPTDILLPGMKLGIDLQTGHQWFLQSWLTYESPAPGSYTFGMDHNFTDQLIIRWLGEIQWTSGPWQDGKFNSWVVGDYKFSYTSNEQERYFNYSVNDDVASFPILQISRFGHLDDHRGLPIACSVGAYCGAYENLPMCSRGSSNPEIKYGFMSREGSKFKESDNMTLGDCRLKCLKNCSCVAYAATNREKKTGCEIWGREAKFTESYKDNYRIIYLKVETKEIKPWIWLIFAIVGALQVILLCSFSYVARRKYKGKEEKWWLSLTVAAGIVLLIPLLCYLCYLAWRKLRAEVQRIMNRRKLLRELEDNLPSSTKNKGGKTKGKDQNMNHELKIFNFQTIVAATNNFSTTNKLGEGGFGPVYKGKLLDAQEIAIKRLSRRSGQGIVEFKNEAKLISKLQHNNLVKLFGCSLQGEERVLVYEYMPNKSLDFFLFDSKRKKLLGWKKRLNIIEGIAQGLIYLHKYSRLKVIHRDLKASNILLDEQMNPKISDFGMARIFGVNESEANTNRVVGTYGYMSPEYAMSGIVSMKTDVFSFGVIVLEIVSGKKNNSCYHTKHPLNLIGYAWQLWNEGKGLELIDTALERSCSPNEVLRCVHVGLLCVQDQAANRPTISDVVSMLANETMLLPAPKQPAFFINVNSEEQEASKIKLDNNSTNDVTISVLEAR